MPFIDFKYFSPFWEKLESPKRSSVESGNEEVEGV